MENFKIILVRDNITTTLIVRSKNGDIKNAQTKNPILNTLDILGLEQVPFSELMPSYKQIKEYDEIIGQTCSICHEFYKIKEYKRSLNCAHTFHKKCIDKWLKTNPNCPICRKDINISTI